MNLARNHVTLKGISKRNAKNEIRANLDVNFVTSIQKLKHPKQAECRNTTKKGGNSGLSQLKSQTAILPHSLRESSGKYTPKQISNNCMTCSRVLGYLFGVHFLSNLFAKLITFVSYICFILLSFACALYVVYLSFLFVTS